MNRINSLFAMLLIAGVIGGCAHEMLPSAFSDGTPEMRPEVFFVGATSSSGVLMSKSGAPTRRLHVRGRGEIIPDGTLRLEQSVVFDQKAPEVRIWLMRRLDAHHYTATLTDASGPVEAEAFGDLLHLRYPMKTPAGGYMEQWMYLQPDGRTVMNEATVRVLGVVVARLSERITREP